jgi:hypothetical protein
MFIARDFVKHENSFKGSVYDLKERGEGGKAEQEVVEREEILLIGTWCRI